MTANPPQILEENAPPSLGRVQSDHESETANSETLEDGHAEEEEDKKETPHSSSLFRHSSCTRRFWIVLFLLVGVLVISLSSLGTYMIVQRNKGSDDQRPSTHMQVGPDMNGDATYDNFGHSVALSADGTRVAIGAPYNGDNGESAGHVRIYDWTEGTGNWTQLGSDLNGEAADDQFGWSVALSSDGTRVAIGTSTGHVRIYDWTGSQEWTQVGSDLNGKDAYDHEFGSIE